MKLYDCRNAEEIITLFRLKLRKLEETKAHFSEKKVRDGLEAEIIKTRDDLLELTEETITLFKLKLKELEEMKAHFSEKKVRDSLEHELILHYALCF